MKAEVIFLNAINKSRIDEFANLSADEANLLIPSNGFVRLKGGDWKVDQIIKSVFRDNCKDEVHVVVHVFVNKVSNSDYYLM